MTHNRRRFTLSDRILIQIDQAMARKSSDSAGLMRVNHAGEVCAQALYQGQALTAKKPQTRQALLQSAVEEADHLDWCAQRLQELGSRTSYLNALWFTASYLLGATVGLLGDRISLGFIAATEEQVCRHLQSHLELLSEDDAKSREILQRMMEDEARHASKAIAHGGLLYPTLLKQAMGLLAKVMTKTAFYL